MKNSQYKKIALEACAKITNPALNMYASKPFKHLVIDNFFPTSIAKSAMKDFPSFSSKKWEAANTNDIEVKKRSQWASEFDIPDSILPVIRVLNSSIFLNAVSEQFKIKKLLPDPYFTGGGLNISSRGGILDIHVDGNYHDATGLNRRLNAILFLNDNWDENWGGDLKFYSEDLKCKKSIFPIFNRLIIFDTHDKSFHGMPEKLNCPKNVYRKSVILYYYTKEPRPKSKVLIDEPHSALWHKKNFTDKRGNKTRAFK